MAELDLESIERETSRFGSPYAQGVLQLAAEVKKLRAFKAYVHDRLDRAGAPADPEPETNAKHGCRIEGRLNHVLGDADRLRVALIEIAGAREAARSGIHGEPKGETWSDFADRLQRIAFVALDRPGKRIAGPGGFVGKCPRCTRVPEIHVDAGDVIGNCAQCWLGEGVHVPFVELVRR